MGVGDEPMEVFIKIFLMLIQLLTKNLSMLLNK